MAVVLTRRRTKTTKTVKATTPTRPSPLLSLPPELRNAIYEIVAAAATQPTKVRSPPSSAVSSLDVGLGIALHPLTLACRQTYREFGPIHRSTALFTALTEAHIFHLNFHGLQTCIDSLPKRDDVRPIRIVRLVNHLPDSASVRLSEVHTEHIASCQAALNNAGARRGFTFVLQPQKRVRRVAEPITPWEPRSQHQVRSARSQGRPIEEGKLVRKVHDGADMRKGEPKKAKRLRPYPVAKVVQVKRRKEPTTTAGEQRSADKEGLSPGALFCGTVILVFILAYVLA